MCIRDRRPAVGKIGIGLQNVTVSFPALKNRDFQRAHHFKRSVRAIEHRAAHAIVSVEGKRWIILGGGRPACEFSGVHLRFRAQIISAHRVRALERFVHGNGRLRIVWNFLREFERLPWRQADGAGKRNALLFIVVSRRNQLLLARLEFHSRA